MQADALSHLNTAGETMPHDENDDIQVFELELVNVGIEENKTPNEFDYMDVKYTELDECFATMDDTEASHTNSEPIIVEELLQAKLHRTFCAQIHRKLIERGFDI